MSAYQYRRMAQYSVSPLREVILILLSTMSAVSTRTLEVLGSIAGITPVSILAAVSVLGTHVEGGRAHSTWSVGTYTQRGEP